MPEPEVLAGRYRLDRILGEGAMGRVWLGYDLLIHRPVAVKQMLASAPDPGLIERALREARSAGSLLHPNVVTVHDLVVLNDRPHVIMEYVDGTTLDDELVRGPISPAEVARIGGQVAAALAAAHALGIVHRDVKPANVLLDRSGTAKLADFGIARIETNPGLTGTGMFIGTLSYMAPEVASGEPARAASDVWSLGATLFRALEGRPVYDGSNNVAVLARLVTEPVPALTASGPIADLVVRMLARDPAQRPVMTEVRDRLAELARPSPPQRDVDATTIQAPPWQTPPLVGRSAPRMRSGRRVALAAAALVVLAGGVVIAVVMTGGDEPSAGGRGSTAAGSTGTGGSTPASRPASTPSTPGGDATSTTGRLSATDPAGDGTPDVTSVRWSATTTTVTVETHFAKRLSGVHSDYFQLVFDTDRNEKTGCGGSDLSISYGEYQRAVSALRYPECGKYTDATTAAKASRLADGIRLVMPRKEFGSASSPLPMMVESGNTIIRDTGDVVPDKGTANIVLP